MAKGTKTQKTARGGIESRTPTANGGLWVMPSGLLHTADSLANSPHGTFVDRFGPPGDPKRVMGVETDSPRNFGSQPSLLKGLAGNKRKGMD